MTDPLTDEENTLNKILSKRCKDFKYFKKHEFNDKHSKASRLLTAYIEYSKGKLHLFDFLSQVDIYLHNVYKVPFNSSNAPISLNITADEFINNFEAGKTNILTTYQKELEDFISTESSKGLIHYKVINLKLKSYLI
jgi:hypothetical protein